MLPEKSYLYMETFLKCLEDFRATLSPEDQKRYDESKKLMSSHTKNEEYVKYFGLLLIKIIVILSIGGLISYYLNWSTFLKVLIWTGAIVTTIYLFRIISYYKWYKKEKNKYKDIDEKSKEYVQKKFKV